MHRSLNQLASLKKLKSHNGRDNSVLRWCARDKNLRGLCDDKAGLATSALRNLFQCGPEDVSLNDYISGSDSHFPV